MLISKTAVGTGLLLLRMILICNRIILPRNGIRAVRSAAPPSHVRMPDLGIDHSFFLPMGSANGLGQWTGLLATPVASPVAVSARSQVDRPCRGQQYR